MAANVWALSQISHLLPLDNESLKQIVEYTSSLPKDAAADHLKNLLGDSPHALEFISSYNARRDAPSSTPAISESLTPHKQKKKKPPLSKLPPPRQPQDYGNTSGAYHKPDVTDYMSGSRQSQRQPIFTNTSTLDPQPSARQSPITSKPPPSASGPLISDLPNVRTTSRPSSNGPSRTSSPAPKTTIAISGGSSMHGASATLADLDSAIRTLEVQTNPSLSQSDPSARRCNCLATRHPLLLAAPNCLNCGKIICVKEGLGPCTFCSAPLLSSSDVQSMIRSLRSERGAEKMSANNASHRRADLSTIPRPFAPPVSPLSNQNLADPSLAKAQAHKDKLLAYQSENAARTTIRDEAADFEIPSSGTNMWDSPMERAKQLKRQQKVLREQEWNAKPEYEKRRVVVSLDVSKDGKGKVVRKMGQVERPEEKEDDAPEPQTTEQPLTEVAAGGAFSNNPLMGKLIRPVWKRNENEGSTGDAGDADKAEARAERQKQTWRRVQDDNDDNEALILDGGIYGGRESERILGAEERSYG